VRQTVLFLAFTKHPLNILQNLSLLSRLSGDIFSRVGLIGSSHLGVTLFAFRFPKVNNRAVAATHIA
jgi:hypothetical protein